ncbi:tRNA pseudouridine(55) synthase TruB [Alicyclobacillus pomorum]|uniref:tRNA pseudouridine(55) synthase TruB n=1 Tax=Alicyclobacillus pomorum TaxID=204470 RepID=UPI000427A34C|nr:tRNA pseudouridine(55) synthase TruB [Alicyclobacillus pomorum]
MSLSGVLILDKPAGLTSHDVVQRVRRHLRTKKVGHAGTLDPDVTGVLVLCIGDATKLIEYATAEDKVYEGTVCFGMSTDTDDASGEVTARASACRLTRDAIERAAAEFIGLHPQVVPKYSAVHVGGKRAYEYARAGLDVTMPTRMVEIHELVVSDFSPGDVATADFQVKCSKGTYVRALCRDWGEKVGIPAHMKALRRTASGPFRIHEAVSLEAFESSPSPEQFLLPAVAAVRSLQKCTVSRADADKLAQGQAVSITGMQPAPQVAVLVDSGDLVCVAHAVGRGTRQVVLKPRKVFWKRDR